MVSRIDQMGSPAYLMDDDPNDCNDGNDDDDGHDDHSNDNSENESFGDPNDEYRYHYEVSTKLTASLRGTRELML